LREVVGPLLEIEDSKRANVSHPVNMDGELPEEVNQPVATFGQTEPQHEGCEYHAKDLLQEDDDLHLIKNRKFPAHIITVQPAIPT
jgi:hypothetical protein